MSRERFDATTGTRTPVKNPTEPTPVTTVSVQPTAVDEIQALLEDAYRTDHLTLPAPPAPRNEEAARVSAMEREAILNPDNGDAIIMRDGTTVAQWREALQNGVLPEGAPEEARAGIGKHSIREEDGVVIVTPPNPEVDREVRIFAPDVQNETDAPSGSELMHSTTPTPDSTHADFNADVNEFGIDKTSLPSQAATPVPDRTPAKSPSDVPIDENRGDEGNVA